MHDQPLTFNTFESIISSYSPLAAAISLRSRSSDGHQKLNPALCHFSITDQCQDSMYRMGGITGRLDIEKLSVRLPTSYPFNTLNLSTQSHHSIHARVQHSAATMFRPSPVSDSCSLSLPEHPQLSSASHIVRQILFFRRRFNGNYGNSIEYYIMLLRQEVCN